MYVINAAAAANIKLPQMKGAWPNGGGYNPGDLGEDLREQNKSIRNGNLPKIYLEMKKKMIRKLVCSLVIVIFCYSCKKKVEPQYKNPIFTTFFKKLNNESIEEFCKTYYKDKPKEYLDLYIPILQSLKKYNSEFIVTEYNQYVGEKPDIDGATQGVYILENKNLKDKIFIKIEDNKVKYIVPIGKGKENIIGWL